MQSSVVDARGSIHVQSGAWATTPRNQPRYTSEAQLLCRFAGHKVRASGGAAASLDRRFHTIASDAEAPQLMSHPYALIPDFSEASVRNLGLPDCTASMAPEWSEAARCCSGPFIHRDIDERVVRMSNALLHWKLGAHTGVPDAIFYTFLVPFSFSIRVQYP